MLKKIPTFVYWMLLAVVVTAVPLACSSSDSNSTDANSEKGSSPATNPG
jgi:hypothetical protein